MRYLEHAVADQIRFGWLPVIAGLVGTKRVSLANLGKALLNLTPQFDRWMQEAGLEGAPRGNARESAVEPLARMGVTFGIHNEATERLTDLGHVLHRVSEWTSRSKTSPFHWNQPQRFIGLRLLLEGSGDVILAILRHIPNTGVVDGEKSLELIEKALHDVLAKTQIRHEADQINVQLERCKGRTARAGVLYPYIEPLRDLGYVVHREKGGKSGYRLTKEGRALKERLADVSNAESLIRSGLARAFLESESIQNIHPTDGRILHTILATLPPELTVSDSEAPLEPICLLAQVQLLKDQPGAWIDPTLASSLVRKVGERIDGRLYLKAGHSMTDFPNVAWNGEIFTDHTIWEVVADEPVEPTLLPHAISTENENIIATDGATNVSKPADGDVLARHDLIAPAETETATKQAFPLPMQSDEIILLFDRPTTTSFRLWVQYAAALLEQPELGSIDLPRWGGFEAGLLRLRGLLDMPDDNLVPKRRPWSRFDESKCSSSGWLPTERALTAVPSKCAEVALVERIKIQWETSKEESRPRPRPIAATERAIASLPDIDALLRNQIVDFVQNSATDPDWKAWPEIREATRCLIQDALSAGRWRASELRSHWAPRIGSPTDPHGQVADMLADLSRPPTQYEYTRSTTLVKESNLAKQLEAIGNQWQGDVVCRTVDDDPNDAVNIELAITFFARSPTEARSIARTRVDFFLGADVPTTLWSDRIDTPLLDSPSWSENLRDAATGNEVEIDLPSKPFPLDVSSRGLVRTSMATRNDVFEQRRKAFHMIHDVDAKTGLEQRISRAWHGLVVARHPQRGPAERLALAWSAIEQLVKSGEQGKGDTVYPVAAAATILHARMEIVRIYCDAMTNLWAVVFLDPQNALARSQFDKWLPEMKEALAEIEHVARPILIRRWSTGKLPTISVPRDDIALKKLCDLLAEIRPLGEAILPLSPLTSNKLYTFVEWFVDDLKIVPETLGRGKKFAQHLRDGYEDFVAFFLHVYELRNRFVHDGDGFGGSNDNGLSHIVERFIAITEPIVAALSKHTDNGYSIDYFWALAEDIYRDWHHSKQEAVLTFPRIKEALFTL